MGKFIIYAAVTGLILALPSFSQKDTCHLIIQVEVLSVPETSFDIAAPPDHAVVIVGYKVKKVLSGIYMNEEIRIAQGVGTLQKIREGDELIVTVRATDEFRESARILREMGIENRSDDSISDYILVEFGSRRSKNRSKIQPCNGTSALRAGHQGLML